MATTKTIMPGSSFEELWGPPVVPPKIPLTQAQKTAQYAALYGMNPSAYVIDDNDQPMTASELAAKKYMWKKPSFEVFHHYTSSPSEDPNKCPQMSGAKHEMAVSMLKFGMGSSMSVLPIIKWWYSYGSGPTNNVKARQAELEMLRAIGKFAHVTKCSGEEVQLLGEIYGYLSKKPISPSS